MDRHSNNDKEQTQPIKWGIVTVEEPYRGILPYYRNIKPIDNNGKFIT